jgi:RNA polymerase sigma factor (sigma-70 family)
MDGTQLAERFETHRARLSAIASRMLGSPTEAEDVIQEVWLRISGHGVDDVRNLGGWLTTVTARVCLDQLRARTLRPLEPLDDADLPGDLDDPEEAAVLADSVGVALLVLLDTLAPAERLAFVLHDLFDVPFGEIAAILDRSPDAAKMLASRARRRIRGAGPALATDLVRQRAAVDAFLAAARDGDMAALLDVLDPGVVARADAPASPTGAPIEVHGARAVAREALSFAGRIAHARPALVDGSVGVAVAPNSRLAVVLTFAVSGDRITDLGIVADPDRLRGLRLVELDTGQLGGSAKDGEFPHGQGTGARPQPS